MWLVFFSFLAVVFILKPVLAMLSSHKSLNCLIYNTQKGAMHWDEILINVYH